MHNPLNRRLPRELKNNLGRYPGIFLLFVVAISFTTGFLVAASSIQIIMGTFREDYAVEDFRFTCAVEPPEAAIDAVEDLDATVTAIPALDVNTTIADDDVTVRAVPRRTEVDVAAYEEGEPPSTATELAIDRTFAAHHDLTVGSEVELAGRTYTVSGIMILPDYNALFESNTDVVMNVLTFTTVELTDDGYDQLKADAADDADANATEALTYAVSLDDRDLTLAERLEVEKDAAKALATNGAQVTDLIDCESNQGIMFALNDTEGDITMWEVLLFMIVIIMGFVFAVLTGATIDEESAIIGTLLASGYRKSELMAHYLVLPTLVGLLGCIVGNVLGYTVIMEPMQALYYNSYSLPPFHAYFDWGVFATTSVVPFVLLVGSTFVGLMWRLRATPLQFLRHEKPGRVHAHGLPLSDRLGFIARFELRVVLSNTAQFVILFLGITFASLLIMFGLCMMPVVEYNAQLNKDALVSEHLYTLKAQIPLSDDEADDAEKVCVSTLELPRAIGELSEELTVYGIDEDSEYWDDLDVSGDRVLVGAGTAAKCGVAAGDTVTFHNKYLDEDYEAIISEVIEDKVIDTSVYMSRETFCEMFGEDDDYFNGYVSDEELDIPSEYVAGDLTPASTDKMVNQMQDSMGGMADMVLVLALVIYLVLVYLLTKTVLDRGARSISQLKVFGYRAGEVNRLYVLPITIAVLVSLVACIPLLLWLLTAAMSWAMVDMAGYFAIIVPAEKLVEEVALGAATYIIVAIANVALIRRVPLVLALKAQE